LKKGGRDERFPCILHNGLGFQNVDDDEKTTTYNLTLPNPQKSDFKEKKLNFEEAPQRDSCILTFTTP
jgi:hypothetical protein